MATRAQVMSGLKLQPSFWSRQQQELVVKLLRDVIRSAPLFTPRMPRTGKSFSVQMTNCGSLGWVSDELGYRYQSTHPETGLPWPPIPEIVLEAWRNLANYPLLPEACLVNVYSSTAKMGLHQDKDEEDFAAPVVSLSLGNTCIFRIGGQRRDDPTRTIRLASGDAVVLGGLSRLSFHGVERIIPGSSTLFETEKRINLTLRRVTKP